MPTSAASSAYGRTCAASTEPCFRQSQPPAPCQARRAMHLEARARHSDHPTAGGGRRRRFRPSPVCRRTPAGAGAAHWPARKHAHPTGTPSWCGSWTARAPTQQARHPAGQATGWGAAGGAGAGRQPAGMHAAGAFRCGGDQGGEQGSMTHMCVHSQAGLFKPGRSTSRRPHRRQPAGRQLPLKARADALPRHRVRHGCVDGAPAMGEHLGALRAAAQRCAHARPSPPPNSR